MAASVIGLAWVGVVCGSSSAGVEQMTFNQATHGSVYTHEMGHNWAMGHDASGALFVMAPSVNSRMCVVLCCRFALYHFGLMLDLFALRLNLLLVVSSQHCVLSGFDHVCHQLPGHCWR
jgi:hypothetical protein